MKLRGYDRRRRIANLWIRECWLLLMGTMCAVKYTYARVDSRSVMLLNVPGCTRTTLVCVSSSKSNLHAYGHS